jgi:hypothetical protein
MANDAHNVDLTVLVDGVAHSLAVYGKALVFLSVRLVPVCKSTIQADGIDANEEIADDGLAGHNPFTLFQPTAEADPGLLPQCFGPRSHRLVTPHPAKTGSGSDCENGGQLMASSLLAARIGDVEEE